MATIATKMTVADYEKVPPPPGGRWELRHGELAKVGFPKREHYNAQRMLAKLLEAIAGPQYVAASRSHFDRYRNTRFGAPTSAWCRWHVGRRDRWVTG